MVLSFICSNSTLPKVQFALSLIRPGMLLSNDGNVYACQLMMSSGAVRASLVFSERSILSTLVVRSTECGMTDAV